MKEHFIVMYYYLKTFRITNIYVGSQSIVSALSVERILALSTSLGFTRGPVGLVTVLILNTPSLPRWTYTLT